MEGVLEVERGRWARRLFGPTKRYRWRPLSEAEWLPHEERFAEAARARWSGSPDASVVLQRAWRLYVRAIGIPERVVFSLPSDALVKVVENLLRPQIKLVAGWWLANSTRAEAAAVAMTWT